MSPMHRIMKIIGIKKSKRILRKDGPVRELQLLKAAQDACDSLHISDQQHRKYMNLDVQIQGRQKAT